MKIESTKRVVITGGSGFMGTHLVQSLIEDNIRTVNIDINPPLCQKHDRYWAELDLLDGDSVFEFFHRFEPTHVVHLAARTDLDEKIDMEGYAVNIRGVEHVLQAIERIGAVNRAIITSSMLVCRVGYKPTSPEDYCPINLYGESKVLTEKITRKMDLPCVWTIIRPTTIWGPYHERMRNGFFATLKRGLYIHPGNKRCLKSYGYVKNSVYQIRKLLDAPPDRVNKKTLYISDPPINLRDWAGAFSRKLAGKDVTVAPMWLMLTGALIGDVAVRLRMKSFPLTTFRLKNMTTENVLDIEPIMSIAGKLPYSVIEGIDKTVAWLNQCP